MNYQRLLPGSHRPHGPRAAIILLVIITALQPIDAAAQAQTYSCPNPGFGPVIAARIPPTLLMQSLKTVPNPVFPHGLQGEVRGDLADYIADPVAAIQLGKAFFWDMQAGSDNRTACATCHFQAGADVRSRNQLHPGANGLFDDQAPNLALLPSHFPFTTAAADRDNVVGSQGIRKADFDDLAKRGEFTTSKPDTLFTAGSHNARQVTGKNAPTTINAIFNHRNFWNGRAQPEFNGVNPWGTRDASARVWMLDPTGVPVRVAIAINNASLASQAVGPALNPVEMSAARRTFPDLGEKLLANRPLAFQRVDPTDSVLGPLADPTGPGLTVSYFTLIQRAFKPQWWNYTGTTTGAHTMMKANFSLYWGIAIMAYESTLVSDGTPMDNYLLTRTFSATDFDPATGMPLLTAHEPTLLDPVVARLADEGIAITRDDILNGLALFETPAAPPPSFPAPSGFGVGCIGCHLGAETTSASQRNLVGHGVEAGDEVLRLAGFDLRMERMFMNLSWNPPGALSPVPEGTDAITFDPATYQVNVIDRIMPFPNGFSTPVNPPIPLPSATYDTGWYNVGIRPTSDDLGLGDIDPFNAPLSWTRLLQQTAPGTTLVPGNTLGCVGAGNVNFPNELLNPSGFPLLSGPLLPQEPTDVDGSFKVPNLRNVELNGPYFHTGGLSTLKQVVEFYDDGGHFQNATKAPAVVPLHLSQQQRTQLVAFLVSLTDDRVRLQQAPFDHPELFVPDGQDQDGNDIVTTLPAVGAAGSTSLQRFLNLSPFQD